MTGTETHYAHERLPSWPRGRLQNSLLGCTAGCLLSERGLRARRLFSGEWSCEQCLVRNRRHSPSVENGRILSLTIQHACDQSRSAICVSWSSIISSVNFLNIGLALVQMPTFEEIV